MKQARKRTMCLCLQKGSGLEEVALTAANA